MLLLSVLFKGTNCIGFWIQFFLLTMKNKHSEVPEWGAEEIRCRPIDTLNGLFEFVDVPPPVWAALCSELAPHSDLVIHNMRVNERHPISLESPRTFCHFSPEEDEVEPTDGDKLPKTLVCHDMANGYHDDSFVDGTPRYDAYTFYNWAGVDIFCYFSHHFVTIPPVSWINVAHAHGVKVIGTLITEAADGTDLWSDVLSSTEKTDLMINSLVTIAKTLKFEGWLLNIENKVSMPEKLVSFVSALHAALHRSVPAAELLWYDSVTNDGNLNWQNKLNNRNRAYFDACDGIFTNYSWTEDDIASSVAEAGTRIRDVFVGIDVWGRNFHGGGQFNTQQAVAVARTHGCSIAIFAPAWTHEAITPVTTGHSATSHHATAPPTTDYLATDHSATSHQATSATRHQELTTFNCFLLRDKALWDSLWPFLNTRLPNRLPFKTSFCKGLGKKRRLYGEVIGPSGWYNLRQMQYQPNASHGPHGYLLANEKKLITVSRHDARSKEGILKYRTSAMSIQKLQTLEAEETDGEGLDIKDGDEKPKEENEDETEFRKAFEETFKQTENTDINVKQDEVNEENMIKEEQRREEQIKQEKLREGKLKGEQQLREENIKAERLKKQTPLKRKINLDMCECYTDSRHENQEVSESDTKLAYHQLETIPEDKSEVTSLTEPENLSQIKPEITLEGPPPPEKEHQLPSKSSQLTFKETVEMNILDNKDFEEPLLPEKEHQLPSKSSQLTFKETVEMNILDNKDFEEPLLPEKEHQLPSKSSQLTFKETVEMNILDNKDFEEPLLPEKEHQLPSKSSQLTFKDTVEMNILDNKDDVEEPEELHSKQSMAGMDRSMVQMSVNFRLGHSTNPATRLVLAAVHSERECMEVNLQDSFIGGSCLTINPSDVILTDPRTIRLFFCDFQCESTLIICVVTKHVCGFEKQTLNLTLCGEDDAKKPVKVTLIGRQLPQTDSVTSRVPIDVKSAAFKQLQVYILLNEPNFYVPVENSYGWKVMYYETAPLKWRVRSINCHTTMAAGPILLGYLGVCDRKLNAVTL